MVGEAERSGVGREWREARSKGDGDWGMCLEERREGGKIEMRGEKNEREKK